MKNIMTMLALVGVLSVQASAADLVSTTFEAGSAGAGSWTLPEGAWQDSLDGEIDPASGVVWQDMNGAMFADVVEAVASEQVAFLGDGDIARLRFAGDTGNDSGSFTITIIMFQHQNSNAGGYTYLLGRNGPDGTSAAWRISWEIRMHNTTNDAVELQAWDGDTLITLATGLFEHAWYDVKIDADYDTDTYDVSYRLYGSSAWKLVADDIDFVVSGFGYGNYGGGDAFQALDAAAINSFGMLDNIFAFPSVPPACGEWGYSDADVNEDCYVNLIDFALMAESWLTCTDPLDSNCVNIQ